MVSIKKFEKMKDDLLNKFGIAEKNEKLSRGALDNDVKRFSVSVLNAMIDNYDNEKLYFELVFLLGEFVYEMGDYETSYQVWTNVDLTQLSDISSGEKEEIGVLEEIRDFYKK